MKRKASNLDGFIVRAPKKSRATLDKPGEEIRIGVKRGFRKNSTPKNDGFPDDLALTLAELPGYDKIKDSNLIDEPEVNDKKLKKALKKAKKQNKKPKKKIKGILIVLAVLLLLIGGGFVAINYLWPKDTISGNWWDAMWSQELKQDSNGFSNILIFGTAPNDYDGPLLADTVLVLSLNQATKEIYLVSLPRDLWVKHECPNPALGTTMGKLNETYRCALTGDKAEDQEADKAATVFSDKASEITGLDVQYYVHMSWAGVQEIVDAIGGIDITIKSSDPRGIYDVNTGIKFAQGETVHMNGETALKYARARGSDGGYGLEGSNFSREKHQQEIIKAIQEKALSSGTLSSPMSLVNLIQALGNNVRTNFSASELQTLANLGKETNTDKMISIPLLNEDEKIYLVENGNINGASVVIPTAGTYDYSEIHQYIKEVMSSDPVVKEKAVIDVLNGSEIAGLASDKAKILRGKGFNIGQISNAPAGDYAAVEIYQLTDKSATAKALSEFYGVEVSKETPPFALNTTADFVIIFGAQ